jgi:hypothetical protein
VRDKESNREPQSLEPANLDNRPISPAARDIKSQLSESEVVTNRPESKEKKSKKKRKEDRKKKKRKEKKKQATGVPDSFRVCLHYV